MSRRGAEHLQVREYEQMPHDSAPARFEKVQAIREKYIVQGSSFEINIETKMRDGAMRVRSRPLAPRLRPSKQVLRFYGAFDACSEGIVADKFYY